MWTVHVTHKHDAEKKCCLSTSIDPEVNTQRSKNTELPKSPIVDQVCPPRSSPGVHWQVPIAGPQHLPVLGWLIWLDGLEGQRRARVQERRVVALAVGGPRNGPI